MIDIKLARLGLSLISLLEVGSFDTSSYFFQLKLCRAGNSGWSFAPVQFDVSVNTTGQAFLRKHFPNDHALLDRIFNDTFGPDYSGPSPQILLDVEYINAGLLNLKDEIIDLSLDYIRNSLTRLTWFCNDCNIPVSDSLLLMMLDYHIQFYISKHGTFHKWLASLSNAPDLEDYFSFKMALPWARKYRGALDIIRRYDALKGFLERNVF